MAKSKPEREEQIQIEILNNRVDLDYPCYECVECNSPIYALHDTPKEITAWNDKYNPSQRCKVCNNTRFLLTETGQAIMNLIERHTPSTEDQ